MSDFEDESNVDIINFNEKVRHFLQSNMSILDYEDKNMLIFLYRFIKKLPEKPIRIRYLKHLKKENERINAELSDERLMCGKNKREEKKKVLLYLLFDAYNEDDLEVFQEIVKIEESVLFMKNPRDSMFELLWSSGTIEDFLLALNLVGSDQPDFNNLLNEKFEKKQTKEICIFLNDKVMSDYEKYYKANALNILISGDFDCLVVNKDTTKFRTISESFFGQFFEDIKDVIKQKCQDPVPSTSADKDDDEVSNSASDNIVKKLLELLQYIFDTQNHLCNISVLTSIDLRKFPKSIQDYMNVTIYESIRLQFLLENNIIWDETKHFRYNFEKFNKKTFKDFSNFKDVKQNAAFIFHLLKLSILKKSNHALCTILDQILVEQNIYEGWAYIDEINDLHTTLVSYAIKWNNIEALKELLRRKARLLLKDDFYEDNLEFFEVKNTELESYFNECMSYVSNNTIICFDFSNFVQNIDFDDDLDFLESNEKEKTSARSESKNKKFQKNVQMVRQIQFVAKKFQPNKCPNDSLNANDDLEFFDEECGVEIMNELEVLKPNEKEKTSARSESKNKKSEKNAQMVRRTAFVAEEFQENTEKSEKNKNYLQFSNIIYEFAKRDYLQHLLMHPIISTQIFLKWHELIYLHILNFSITLCNLIYFLYFQVYKDEFEHIWGCYSILFIFLLHKSLRIIMRIQPYCRIKRSNTADDYKTLEKLIIKMKRNRLNILNVVLLISIIWTTIRAALQSTTNTMDNPEAYNGTRSANETTKIEADTKMSSQSSHVDGTAFTCMLLLAIDVGRVIKSLPVSTISDYISMLEQVTYTYIKVLLIFSNFIIVFTVCFMTLFKDGFQLFFPSIIKIITMTIGEFNVSELQLETLSFWHKLLFFLFVFFMAFVIINLLNGLAVSDVQDIRVKATLHNLTYKVNELYSYEENFKFMRKYIFKCKWSSNLLKNCFARKKYASKIYIQSNTGDVSHFLIPVRSVKNSMYVKGELGQMFQANLKLDKRIVQTANEILTSKILEDQNKKIEEKISDLEAKFARVCEKISI